MVPFECESKIDPKIAIEFHQRRLEIEEAEPPKLRVIDLLCHNELVAAKYQHGKVYPIGPLRRWLGHLIDLEVTKILDKPRDLRLPESGPVNSAVSAA